MIMEVFGVPPLTVMKRAKRKDKFFLTDTVPIKIFNKNGKLRKPGQMSLEAILDDVVNGNNYNRYG